MEVRTMSEQNSQKQGVASSSQKEAETRNPYSPTGASKPVAGAFGNGAAEDEGEPSFINDEDVRAKESAR